MVAHLARDPTGQDLAALLLAEPAAREVAPVHERHDIDDDLVLVEDSVDDHGNYGCEVRLAGDLNKKATTRPPAWNTAL